MKPKNDIITNYFHDEYAKEFGQLNINREKSRRLYARIIKCLFDFIKEKLYQGFTFTTTIGQFRIEKVNLNPRSEKKPVLHNESRLQGRVVYLEKKREYFHTLFFISIDNLQDRYSFKPLQKFSREIHLHYD